MSTLSKKIKEKAETPYQKIAKEFKSNALYVGQIARGERKPIRGKGLKIKKALEELANQK